MAVCQKTKAFTDFFWDNRSLQLDHSSLKLVPMVKRIRASHDALKDALYNGGLSERYNLWKRSVKWPELIDKTTLAEKMSNGAITFAKNETPETLLFKRIQRIEHTMFWKGQVFDFSKKDGLVTYKNMDTEIKELFPNEAEYHQYMSWRYELYQSMQFLWHDLEKYYKISNASSKDFALNMFKDLETNEAISILDIMKDTPWTTFDDYKNALTESIWSEIPKPLQTEAKRKEIERLAEDMLFQTQPTGPLMKMFESLHHSVRNVVIPLKYTVWVTSGMKLLVSNTVMGAVQLFARWKWMSDLINSDFIKYLQDEEWILKSEMRLDANVEFGEWWIDTLGRMVSSLNPESKTLDAGAKATARVLQWGWHNIWDIVSDAWAKRTALAEAMAEMGIDGYNLHVYENQARKWIVMPSLIDEIRTRAHDKYSAFYTNSKTASRTTNRFSASKYLAFNFMQWYTMKRAAQIVSSVTDLSDAIKLGKVRDIQDFKRYLDGPEWAELRNLIMTSLLAAKVAVYVETNQAENEYLGLADRAKKIKEYAFGLNDYINAAEGSIIGRLIENTFKYGTSQYVYVDENGNYKTEYGGVDAAALWFIQEATSSLYKEFNVFSMVPALMQGARTSVGFDFAIEAADKELGRVINGIGRFSLSPGDEMFWLKPYWEESDDVSEWLMVKNDMNQTMRISDKIRTMEDISQFMDTPWDYTWNMLWKNILPLKLINKFRAEPDDINKEASYELLNNVIEKDKIANDFYNGKFNRDVLYTKQDALMAWNEKLSNVDWMFKSLVAFQSAEMWNNWLLQLSSQYGINDGSYDALVQRLIEEVGPQTYKALVIDQNEKSRDRNMAMLRAAMDAKVPWAGRMLLSFMAKQDYTKELKARYGTTFDSDISEIEREWLQKEILAKYGNQMINTDEYARLQFVTKRAEQLYPNFLNENPEVTRVVNSAALMSLMVNEQAKQWDLNSRYLGSVLSLAWKYMPDNLRLPIIEKTFYEIDNMKVPENVKTVLKTWVWLWNVDFIGKIAKDPQIAKKYGSTVDNVLNLLYNTAEKNSKVPNTLALETGNTDKKNGKSYTKWSRSYASNYWDWKNSYQKESWATGWTDKEVGLNPAQTQDNARAREQFSQKLAWLNTKFKRSNTIKLDKQPVSAYKKQANTPIKQFYVKALESALAQAQSEKLENSQKSNTLGTPAKKQSAKIGYKSKKWKVVELKVPKAAKLKTSKYKW